MTSPLDGTNNLNQMNDNHFNGNDIGGTDVNQARFTNIDFSAIHFTDVNIKHTRCTTRYTSADSTSPCHSKQYGEILVSFDRRHWRIPYVFWAECDHCSHVGLAQGSIALHIHDKMSHHARLDEKSQQSQTIEKPEPSGKIEKPEEAQQIENSSELHNIDELDIQNWGLYGPRRYTIEYIGDQTDDENYYEVVHRSWIERAQRMSCRSRGLDDPASYVILPHRPAPFPVVINTQKYSKHFFEGPPPVFGDGRYDQAHNNENAKSIYNLVYKYIAIARTKQLSANNKESGCGNSKSFLKMSEQSFARNIKDRDFEVGSIPNPELLQALQEFTEHLEMLNDYREQLIVVGAYIELVDSFAVVVKMPKHDIESVPLLLNEAKSNTVEYGSVNLDTRSTLIPMIVENQEGIPLLKAGLNNYTIEYGSIDFSRFNESRRKNRRIGSSCSIFSLFSVTGTDGKEIDPRDRQAFQQLINKDADSVEGASHQDSTTFTMVIMDAHMEEPDNTSVISNGSEDEIMQNCKRISVMITILLIALFATMAILNIIPIVRILQVFSLVPAILYFLIVALFAEILLLYFYQKYCTRLTNRVHCAV
ncbi:unnamed protein product [Caenorhabditis bovis]|uniref:Uncharacterized protein n=1 Tax=Caenorhabditis bovis TaxID=2654633 RepID=A0A8S1ENV2_9PELO|nr:unnamed protein product [Caenorhabditis bovis]